MKSVIHQRSVSLGLIKTDYHRPGLKSSEKKENFSLENFERERERSERKNSSELKSRQTLTSNSVGIVFHSKKRNLIKFIEQNELMVFPF